jgi:hypothetical protein
MRSKVLRGFCIVAALAISSSAIAQEGFPLTGVWYGDWGANAKDRNQVTIIMNWDGKAVTGTLNPGPDAMPLKVATLDSSKWTVHIEAEGKDEKGKAVHYVADGKLDNIGSYKRTISGAWNDGSSAKNDFKLTRD